MQILGIYAKRLINWWPLRDNWLPAHKYLRGIYTWLGERFTSRVQRINQQPKPIKIVLNNNSMPKVPFQGYFTLRGTICVLLGSTHLHVVWHHKIMSWFNPIPLIWIFKGNENKNILVLYFFLLCLVGREIF